MMMKCRLMLCNMTLQGIKFLNFGSHFIRQESTLIKTAYTESNRDVTEEHQNEEKTSSFKKTKKKAQNTALVKLPKKQLAETLTIGSVVVSLQEIACLTMKHDLTITSWQRYPIFMSKSNKRAMHNIEDYYNRISEAFKKFPLVEQDLWIMEDRHFNPSVPFLSSHFLISKTILLTLLSETFTNQNDRKVVFGMWSKTGRVFDLMIEGNAIRKSGKEKVTEILKSGSWSGNKILYDANLVKINDSGVAVRDKTIDPARNNANFFYEKLTEEMADAFLQGLAFWLTSQKSE